jgi:DHA3 family macrolide efflux protein-like MFS transporter
MVEKEWAETNWKSRFFSIWGGQAVSLFGSQLVQFALIWWLTEQTRSATVLATATLVGMLPQIVLGPLVGTLVDRWNRRTTMILADSAIALATLVLAWLFLIEQASVTAIYVLLFVRSLGGAFHYPSMSAATSLMVPKQHLTRVQGFNQMLQGGLSIVSAPLGALLIALMPMQGILLIDVVSALAAILPLFLIRIPEPKPRLNGDGTEKPTSVWADFREGLAYLRNWPGLLMLMLLAMVINFLLSPAGALFPLLVTEHFNGGALELGWVNAAMGIGVFAGGLMLGAWGGFKKKILTSLLGLLILGTGFASVGFISGDAFLLAIASIFVVGVTLPMVNGPIHAIMQSSVAPSMQGRVFTLVGSLAAGIAPLGLIIAGPVADTLGIQTWYVIGGSVCVLMGVIGFFVPAIINIEEGREQAVQTEGMASIDAVASAEVSAEFLSGD